MNALSRSTYFARACAYETDHAQPARVPCCPALCALRRPEQLSADFSRRDADRGHRIRREPRVLAQHDAQDRLARSSRRRTAGPLLRSASNFVLRHRQLGDDSLPETGPDLGSDDAELTDEQGKALQTLHHVLLEVTCSLQCVLSDSFARFKCKTGRWSVHHAGTYIRSRTAFRTWRVAQSVCAAGCLTVEQLLAEHEIKR
jgi:hypothetical protein